MSIPWAELSSVGPWGLVTLFVLLVFMGYLVPAREAREWKKAFFQEQEMRRDLEVTGMIQRTVLRSIPTPPDEEE